MFIGTLIIDLFIPESNSLKYKRQVVKSVKDKIKRNFNVGVAEDNTDKWQRTRIFVVGVNGSKLYLERVFSSVEKMVASFRNVELIDTSWEFF
ncbi:MAG TPA: DUF503 domain-containing protein [Candidatus Omnitrophica bacterium]|nr:MAG: DUF503 domain-containing protein [Candidatus Omnitrophota bacterium]RKY44213.1 MAG: DUF503 domain-containing protein [Candidatus Omnitrophota bacterium]HEC69958.1 DUF503 domain-containing protein [Candidatus Omnitrophota bacterium]